MTSILIVDDHHLLIRGYKSTLRELFSKDYLSITEAHDCQSAYHHIVEAPERKYDVVFLDISLPPYPEKRIENGEDIGMLIRRHRPNTKILVLTSHPESILLYEFNKKVRPDGLMVKSDFTVNDLKLALNTILKGERHISPTVKKALSSINNRDYYFDNFNRQIISLLAKGIQTKNIHKYLPLSISAIDKRKAQIKEYFLIGKGTDEDIIREARKAGMI